MSKTCKLNILNLYSGLLYKKLSLLNIVLFRIISSFYSFSSALNACNIRIIENIIDTTPPWHINTKYQNIRVSVCFNGIALTHVAVNLTLVLYSSSSPFRQDGLHCEFMFDKKLFVLYQMIQLKSWRFWVLYWIYDSDNLYPITRHRYVNCIQGQFS